MFIWETLSIISISVFLIALAFICLVVFACIFLVSMARSIKKVKQQVTKITEEGTGLIHHADDIMHGIDPYSHIIGSFGRKIERKICPPPPPPPHKENGCRGKCEPEGMAKTVMDITDWALIGISIWESFKKKSKSRRK